VFGRFGEVIQCLSNKGVEMLDDGQKEFRAGNAGCLEHNCTINMIVDHAVSLDEELYMVALDFIDAFGFVPHDLIEYSLRYAGFNEDMMRVIADSYCGSSSRICTAKGHDEEREICRGVKQRCMLSTTLFNLCIITLLKRLKKYKMFYRMQV
jgi:hypothetical protein